MAFDIIVNCCFHSQARGSTRQLFSFEAMEDENEVGAEIDFRPRVAFEQEDFKQLLVQVM